MDPLTDFLDGPRARKAFLLQVVMSPPWSIAVDDGAPLTVVAVLHGKSWVVCDGAEPQELAAGDILLVRGDDPYLLSSELGLVPSVRVGRDQQCSGADGRDLSAELASGVRTWGNDPAGDDVLLVGTFRSAGEVGKILLAALPPSLVVRSAQNPMVDVLAQEVVRDGIAQASVLDRLLDLVLIGAVRAWAQTTRDPRSVWLNASRDPIVREVITLIHEDPGRAWTVELLATSVSTSRASLARRFAEEVGTSPIAYLTQWRLTLAADLLTDPHLTLTTISQRVGYSTPFSFSAAFKKYYGVSPRAYRAS
ncbi:AraC family transcriptional regulator [Sanguibacter suaedae]|uniref:AraC family transcriptional regulator n=1 Tax=Sanguibacter suaedae TaxID=2795737 RepID=A0A934I8V0_9MICO|nr:AraC family transcriptional regulator [Sanguibacter suaedae]MBI9115247.1 AraC family transcriptional regulator [Sanguibacter suaedae]